MDITKLFEYIDNQLFENLFILHPEYAVNGKISDNIDTEIALSKTKVVICVDRNVLSRLLAAVKKGFFSGNDREEITVFFGMVSKK